MDAPFLFFFSKEAVISFLCLVCLGLYIYFGWVYPIMHLRKKDISKREKRTSILLLVVLGILPLLLIIFGIFFIDPKISRNRGDGINVAPIAPPPPAAVNPGPNIQVSVPAGAARAQGLIRQANAVR